MMYPSLPPICFHKSTTFLCRLIAETKQWDANHLHRPELWVCAKVCSSASNQQHDWKKHVAMKPNKMPASPYYSWVLSKKAQSADDTHIFAHTHPFGGHLVKVGVRCEQRMPTYGPLISLSTQRPPPRQSDVFQKIELLTLSIAVLFVREWFGQDLWTLDVQHYYWWVMIYKLKLEVASILLEPL